MASRRLDADEAALWARVMAGVRPLTGVAALAVPVVASSPVRSRPSAAGIAMPGPVTGPSVTRTDAKPARQAGNTLDGTWDRQLSRGLVVPHRTVDLHGHTLASAHAMLDGALDDALRSEARLLLLVTGKPPRPASERPHARGAIRAAVGDWLAGSRFADRIAAVRAAHPRHGGAGALYIVLRKPRTPRKS